MCFSTILFDIFLSHRAPVPSSISSLIEYDQQASTFHCTVSLSWPLNVLCRQLARQLVTDFVQGPSMLPVTQHLFLMDTALSELGLTATDAGKGKSKVHRMLISHSLDLSW